MGLFKKFLPDGWVEEEIPQEQPIPVKQEPAQTQKTISLSQSQHVNAQSYQPATHPVIEPVPQIAYAGGASSFTAISTAPDPEYLKFIDGFFEKENLPGMEYFEFRTSVRNMIEGGLPVKQAFENTFTVFKTMGVTKEKLIETNEHYQSRLKDLQNDFEGEANAIVTSKQAEFTKSSNLLTVNQNNLQKEEDKLRERLIQIETERKANDEELQKLQNGLNDITNAQELRKSKMVTANNYVIGIIADDEKAIQTFLK